MEHTTKGHLQIRDEIIAVQSIFGDDIVTVCEDDIMHVEFPRIGASPSISIRVAFPETYPGSSPPVVEIQSLVLDTSMVEMMIWKLEKDMFVPGEEVCFEWLSWVNEEFEQCTTGTLDAHLCIKHDDAEDLPQTSPRDNDHDQNKIRQQHEQFITSQWDIFHGEVSELKKSTFQGHVAQVSSLQDVEHVMECLLQNNKIQHATHNIMAYRFYMDTKNGTRTLLQDCDDDGEAAAGKRLLHLLQVMDVQGLIVIVSRWYGGVHLGPARFQCINNAGRTAIEGFLLSIEEGHDAGLQMQNQSKKTHRGRKKY